jgi:hypothetical protein
MCVRSTETILNMTENHGVPGSNPGPATSKNPANSRKMTCPGDVPGAFYRRPVNSRIKIRLLSGRLSRSPTCLLWRGCRWRESSCYGSSLDCRSQGGVMAAEARVDVHHCAPRCLLGHFDSAAGGFADWSEFDAEAERLSIEVCGLSRVDLRALIEHRAGSSKGPGHCNPLPNV